MEFIQGESPKANTPPKSHLSQTSTRNRHRYRLCPLPPPYPRCYPSRPQTRKYPASQKQDQVKVIDFGIAQLLTEKDGKRTHGKTTLIGTPIYMSPEQQENPETVSYPSDIYSLGIITYELVLRKTYPTDIYTFP